VVASTEGVVEAGEPLRRRDLESTSVGLATCSAICLAAAFPVPCGIDEFWKQRRSVYKEPCGRRES
jgi:hypothetical protein